MGWPAYWPAAAESDIQTNFFLDNLETAADERIHAASGCGNPLGSVISGAHHTLDDDLQSANYYNTIQALMEGESYFFVPPGVPLTGGINQPGEGFTMLGYASSDPGPFFALCGFTDLTGGWKATYPKEMPHTTSTDLSDGDAAVAGDKAICEDDGLVYQYAGGGVWNILGWVGPFKPDTKTVYRRMIQGDYLNDDGHVFNEIKTAMMVLIDAWTVGETATSPLEDSEARWDTVSDSNATWAGAKTDSEARYAALGVTAGMGGYPACVTIGFYNLADDTFNGQIWVSRTKIGVHAAGVPAFSFTTDVYLGVDVGPYGPPVTFDNNGIIASVAPGLELCQSIGPSALQDRQTGFVGPNPNTPFYPAWTGAPDNVNTSTVRGWITYTPFFPCVFVSHFAVPGGYTMQ
jgi:hypothetical protein